MSDTPLQHPLNPEENPRRDHPVVPCWMSKREYFAALAMQGVLSAYGSPWEQPEPRAVATESLQFADALLAALEK